ncbi:hypothetical protein QL285_091735 [Trifolium repens]|nr:hypothetical protein QL285_091735 [Trifolium repens]
MNTKGNIFKKQLYPPLSHIFTGIHSSWITSVQNAFSLAATSDVLLSSTVQKTHFPSFRRSPHSTGSSIS